MSYKCMFKVLDNFHGYENENAGVEIVEENVIRKCIVKKGPNDFMPYTYTVQYKGKQWQLFNLPKDFGRLAGKCINITSK